MKSKLVLTEEEITSLIKEAVESAINIDDEDSILIAIADKITDMGEINATIGENDLYGEIKIGDFDVDIHYTVETDSYWGGAGDPGDYYHEPQSPELVNGEMRVFVTEIAVNSEESDDVIPIEDNGIIANALKNVIVLDPLDLPKSDYEYDEPDLDDDF